MTLALIVLLPLLGSFLPLLTDRRGRSLCALATMLPPVIGMILLWQYVPAVFAGETIVQGWPWLTQLGLNLSFRLDGWAFCSP